MADFVLVHGGFCRSGIWADTAAALEARGHRTVAPDLASSGPDPAALGGLHDDVEAVRRALEDLGGDAVVVAHSGGGLALAELADHPAVRHSVYVAGLRPQPGQTAAELLGGGAAPWMAVSPEEGAVRVSDDPDTVHAALCADIERDRFLRDVRPQYVAMSLQVLGESCSAPASGHPTTYVICEDDRAIPVEAQEAMAALGDHVERLPSSHSPLLSMPERLAEVLERAATRV
jgi:pimeloyl-ACP methyl ester carboxylesterase